MSKPSLPVIHHIAANLRRIRQQRGLTQDALAQAAGVSRRMLVNIEAHESNVSFATLDRLANALLDRLANALLDRLANALRAANKTP